MKKVIVDSLELVRLDRYLRRLFPNLTQGVVERFLRNGKIKVNGSKAKSNSRLKTGDEVTLFDTSFQDDSSSLYKHRYSDRHFSESCIALAVKLLGEYLLLDTNEFIAIEKPHNLAVQGGSKISLSVDDAISYLNSINGTDFKLVHRLDKDTSGVLLIARGANNATKLGKAFKEKLIQKTYQAVLCGALKEEQGTITNYIGKDRNGVFEVIKELSEGKEAVTLYRVISANQEYSFVEFKPLTGRMHQLRVHSKLLGCPILGDVKYGGKVADRMMLHARKIVLPQEVFGSAIVIEAKEPKKWKMV